MTADELWQPDEYLGRPVKVGEWLYGRTVPLAVRLFRSHVLYGSGDDYDDPDEREDRAIDCYYMEFEVAGEGRWGSRRAFLSLDDVERFGRTDLDGSLRWCGE